MNFNYWDVECECEHTRREHRVHRLSDGTFDCFCLGKGVIDFTKPRCKCKDFEESFASSVKRIREEENGIETLA